MLSLFIPNVITTSCLFFLLQMFILLILKKKQVWVLLMNFAVFLFLFISALSLWSPSVLFPSGYFVVLFLVSWIKSFIQVFSISFYYRSRFLIFPFSALDGLITIFYSAFSYTGFKSCFLFCFIQQLPMFLRYLF